MTGAIVYVLCAGTAAVCAWLLLAAYGRARARFLLWAGLCFVGFTLNNLLVFVDLVLVRDANLIFWRNLAAVASVAVLLYGLVWDTGREQE